MALVSGVIPNLVGGVSQQPPALRLVTTSEQTINAWPSIVSGLLKRPPSQHLATLSTTVVGGSQCHLIERNPSYRYMVVVQNEDLSVININDGTAQTVSFPDGKSYLKTSRPSDDIRFLTFGDFTFILNRTRVVEPYDVGEFGTAQFTPDGTVANIVNLPASAPVGTIYKVTSNNKFYQWTRTPATPAEYRWSYDGETSSPPAGYTVVSTLDIAGSAGLKRALYEQRWTGGYRTSGSDWSPDGLAYEDVYKMYTSVISVSAVPESFAWKEITPLTSGDRLNPATRAVVYVTQAVANTYYSVYINGVKMAEYLTPKGVDAASSVPDTGVIAQELANDLIANGYTVVKTGSTVVITNLDSDDEIQCQGNTGDKSVKGYKDSVPSFSDLPPVAPSGLIMRVQGDLEEAGDDYYVIYKNNSWEETYGFGEKTGYVWSTMPHVLVRNPDGTWVFKIHEWADREAGDKESNKDPTFVGRTINDIFVYSNRMGFLSDENLILSEADNFENFYRATVAQNIDSDRIDLAVLHNNVDILQHAVPFNKDLMLMSDQNQFRFSYQNFVSTKTSQVRYTTSFNVSSRVRPINMGNSLYFVDDRPDYAFAKLMEYFPKENVSADDAEDVTAAAPEYVKSDIGWMAGSNRADAILVHSNNDPSTLYLYKFYWSGDRKVQTSWSKWTFNDCLAIHYGAFSGNDLFLLVQRPLGLSLEKIRLDEDVFDQINNYELLMDRRTTNVTKTYDPILDTTLITTPWSTPEPLVEIVSTGGEVYGYRHQVTKVANNQFRVKGDITTHTITVGIPYTLVYEFSPVFVRQGKGQGEVVVLDGRLQVRYISVEYHDTAYFQTHLFLPGRAPFIHTFSAFTVGSPFSTLGKQAFSSGVYRIPVMSKNLDARLLLINDSPFPSAFGSAEWQAMFSPKSRQRL